MPGLLNSNKRLSPNKLRRRVSPGPQGGKLHLCHGGRGHLEDDLASMTYNLGRDVDDPTPQGGGIGLDGNYILTNILLEGIEEKKGYQHGVIEGRIGRKTQKRQFFKAKILQAAMHQFVRASAMGFGDDLLRQTSMLQTNGGKTLVDFASPSQVGTVDRQRSGKFQQPLFAGHYRSAQDGTAERIPVAASVSRFQIIPGLLVILITSPLTAVSPLRQGLYLFIDPAATDIANPQLVEGLKELLVKKTGIQPDDDGHFLPIVFANELDDVADHHDDGVPIVAVFAAAPTNRDDNLTSPSQLQGLKAFHPLIGGLDAMAFPGLIIIHYHGVQTQDNHLGFGDLQPPPEKLLQQTTKKPDAKPGESSEKSFDRMRGEHLFRGRLDGRGIAVIFFQGIKVNQVSAGPIYHEAKHLLENLRHWLSLGAFAHGAKKTF